jgi:hypothetical protein
MKIGFFIKSLNAYHAHVKSFIEQAPGKNYSFIVFHMNNLYTPNFKLENILCEKVDLSKKTNYNLELKKLNIDFFVSLNPGNLFDLLLIACCKQLNVCTIYYQHGIQLDFSSFNPTVLSRNKTFKKKKLTIKKYFFFYAVFLKNVFLFKRKNLIIQTVFTKTKHLINSKKIASLPKYGLHEMHIDWAFVYGEADKNYLISSMSMNSDRIIVSGYPFIEASKNLLYKKSEKKVLYISSGLRIAGVIPFTVNDEKQFYLKLNDAVKNANCQLVVKMHPQEDLDLFESFFCEQDNVELHKYSNLADLTIISDIIIGDYSTALFYAIKYYKPILITESEFFKNYPFDLTKYGIGKKVKMDEITSCLNNRVLSEEDNNNYDFFLKNKIQSSSGKLLYDIFFKSINRLFQTGDMKV